jgi:hypothetical protein
MFQNFNGTGRALKSQLLCWCLVSSIKSHLIFAYFFVISFGSAKFFAGFSAPNVGPGGEMPVLG